MTEIPSLQITKRRFSNLEKRDVIFSLLALAILMIFLSKSLESSLVGNLQLLAASMATIGIVAAGQTLVIITGGIDLSVGSIVGLTSMITAYLATIGVSPFGTFNPWIAALVALMAATGVGWLNGTLVSRYKLAPFIVTFGMLNVLRGTAGLLSNGTPINLGSNAFDWVWARAFNLIPVPAILLVIVFVITAYLLRNSRYGRYTYAIGSNETVAHLSGVNINRTRQIIYAASGFLAGLSGLLLLSLIKGGAYQNGQYYELFSVAAVIIGGTSLRGGSGSIWGTLIGVLVIAMVRNGLILFSVPPLWNELIIGAVIIAAALIDLQRRRLAESIPSAHLRPDGADFQGSPRPKTFDQALRRFTDALEDQFEYSVISVYLINRDTSQLVSSDGEPCAEGTLAVEVYTCGKAMSIADLRRDHAYELANPRPESRAAVAVPIIREGLRVIGVAEFQSTSPGALSQSEIDSMMSLCSQLAGTVEDTWLLEDGWLTRQIRDNLRNLADEAYLDKSELGEWLFFGRLGRGEALRHMLLDAIDYLHSEHLDANSRALRRYQILRQTYVDQKHVEAIIHDLGLSRRQYFYDLKEGIDAVTHYLFTQRQVKVA